MSTSILVIEDNPDLQTYLREILVEERYMVHIAGTAVKGRELFFDVNPDLVILDLHLPDIDGETIRNEFKKVSPTTPIIILTAENSPQAIARNLRAGADDYISKPFTSEELLARVSVRMREMRDSNSILKANDIEVNKDSLEVSVKGKYIDLTKTEFELLLYLMENKNKILTREMILSRVWSTNPDIETRVVDVYVGYLRKKLEQFSDGKLIYSKRGYGYSIKD